MPTRLTLALALLLPVPGSLAVVIPQAQITNAAPAGSPGERCHALQHHEISASEIALPTRGAFIQSARHEGSHNGFCRLRGEIRSVDPAANPIRFELNLPDRWNGKALQYGGGTFDGYVQTGLNGLRHLWQRLRPPPSLSLATRRRELPQREVRDEH